MNALKKIPMVLLLVMLLLNGCGSVTKVDIEESVSKETQEDFSKVTTSTVSEPTPEPTTEPTPEPSPEPTPTPEITEKVVEKAYVDEVKVAEVEKNEVQAMKTNVAPAVSIVLTPVASGERVEQNGEAVIDFSHSEDGYVMVQYTAATDNRLKVQVKGPVTTYTYDLVKNAWTVFPFSDGNGDYQVTLYKNVVDSKYAAVISSYITVAMKDEFAPFLRPNQYVNFQEGSNVVNKGAELTAGLEDPLEKVEKIYDYVVANLSYDNQKAATVTSGYLPVLDQVLNEKKGICFDYASLMTAMLRSQGVPCKLIVGYAGQTYHAWINVWTENSGWVDGAIFFDGHMWKRMDPTFASSGSQSAEIMDYISKDTNYTVKYQY